MFIDRHNGQQDKKEISIYHHGNKFRSILHFGVRLVLLALINCYLLLVDLEESLFDVENC